MRSSYLYHGDPYAHKIESLYHWDSMMMISNGNIFCVTGLLCGEFTGHRWIPLTKASDAELWWVFFICAWTNNWANNGNAGDLRRHCAHYDVTIISPLVHSRASEHIKYEYHLCNKVAHLSCCVACAKLWPDCMITRNYSKKIFYKISIMSS